MKRWLLVVALYAIAIPLWAIVSGQSLTNKLKDLCAELRMTCQQRSKAQRSFDEDYERQHQKMLDVINKSNDLSILLYTQEQNMTFDLTSALKKVSSEYKDFSKDRRPYDHIVNELSIEIDRYGRLIEALRRLPPMLEEIEEEILPDSLLYHNDTLDLQVSNNASTLENEVIECAFHHDTHEAPLMLDEGGQFYRDSCIQYASEILKMYADNRATVIADSSVNIAVKQYVLVPERIGYVDRSKEVIYEALNAAGITIPFPQCDVHLIKDDTEGNQKL